MPTPKNMKYNVQADVYVTRYEDTDNEGYATMKEAIATAGDYLDELIKKKVSETDQERPSVRYHSLASRARKLTVVKEEISDNGEESDGQDEGRWTITWKLLAEFQVVAGNEAEAKQAIEEEIGEMTWENVLEDSIEEYACDFSFEVTDVSLASKKK